MISLTSIQKRLRHLWHAYGTLNNIITGVALCVAASWAWGTVTQMQVNFAAQKAVDEQQRQLELTELQVATLTYQQNYYKSDEYKDLAARESLGLALPGEKLLVLPPNSQGVKDRAVTEQSSGTAEAVASAKGSNVQQWVQFLTGQSAQSLRS